MSQSPVRKRQRVSHSSPSPRCLTTEGLIAPHRGARARPSIVLSAVCLRNERRTGIDEVQQPETKPPCAPIKLSVVCGPLAFARCPVLVGHYSGDTQVLEGRLTAR